MDAKVMEFKELLDQIAAVKQLRKEARARWDSNTGPWCDVQNRMHEVERLESKLSELAAVQLPALIAAAARSEQLEQLREAVIADEALFNMHGMYHIVKLARFPATDGEEPV